jgi:hypothetical protein
MYSYRIPLPPHVQMDTQIGQAPVQAPVQQQADQMPQRPLSLVEQYPTLWKGYQVAAAAGGVLGAYHGYKRTESIGWAIGWSLLGGLFPFITIPIAYAQGFGQRAKR